MIIRYSKAKNVPEGTLKRATSSDAGADLCSTEAHTVLPLGRCSVGTGLFLEIPEGYYGRIAPRSGLASKHGIDVLAGVVDSGYRGEIKILLYNTDRNEAFQINPGDKVAQLIIERHYNFEFSESDALSGSERGDRGFGSSG